jgi:hypothetical protein
MPSKTRKPPLFRGGFLSADSKINKVGLIGIYNSDKGPMKYENEYAETNPLH